MMPSWPQLLILILVIVLLFGTKKLRSLGSDLGASIKGFKKAMSDEEGSKSDQQSHPNHIANQDVSEHHNDSKKE